MFTWLQSHYFEMDVLSIHFSDSLFGPLEFSRRDLASLNIQRGRDHGLADYNTVREAYGLKRKETWTDINKNYNIEVCVLMKCRMWISYVWQADAVCLDPLFFSCEEFTSNDTVGKYCNIFFSYLLLNLNWYFSFTSIMIISNIFWKYYNNIKRNFLHQAKRI